MDIKALLKIAEVGNCVICGQKTTGKIRGVFVCDYDDKNSMFCRHVYQERVERDNLRPDIDNDPGEFGYGRSRQEKYINYKSYINSFDWQVKADNLKRIAGHRCQQCGEKKTRRNLHVHHRHYKTLYHEGLSDVEVLCAQCHKNRHGKKPGRGNG